MNFKCPGRDSRNIKAETLGCPCCGYSVEIFSDETRIRCPSCRGVVSRQALPSCAQWCSAAKECLGR
ncbi:MAG TPA: phosphohydrolase [Patescibacteria group bacterium]|nr:phosphohydrolase [Patescibacteria group bacterium]